jgi:hypothetical protein
VSGNDAYLPGPFGASYDGDRNRRPKLDKELTPRQLASRLRNTMHERSLRAKMAAAAKRQTQAKEEKPNE